jgi:hypothetical protein
MSQRIHQLDHALISSMKAEEELEKNKKGRRAVRGGATATTASAGVDALRAHISKHTMTRTNMASRHSRAHRHADASVTPVAPTSFLAATSAPCSSVVPCPCGDRRRETVGFSAAKNLYRRATYTRWRRGPVPGAAAIQRCFAFTHTCIHLACARKAHGAICTRPLFLLSANLEAF